MESLTNQEFTRLEAYDRVMPLDHTQRMLGFIAHMLSQYLGLAKDGDDTIEKMCLPWLPTDGVRAKDAVTQLKGSL